MRCDEIQELLPLYCDDGLAEDQRTRCNSHMEVCPVCRSTVAQLRALRLRLATMQGAAPPVNLVSTIQDAVRAEAIVQRARRRAPMSELFVDYISVWLQPRAMRYAFSSVISILIFSLVFLALRPHMIALHEAAGALNDFTAAVEPGTYNIYEPITPSNYAALRKPYNAESPSLNPDGGIATLSL